MFAYQQMTPEEREKYDALVEQLDAMLAVKRNTDRRRQVVPISFPDRRISDRRRGLVPQSRQQG